MILFPSYNIILLLTVFTIYNDIKRHVLHIFMRRKTCNSQMNIFESFVGHNDFDKNTIFKTVQYND